MLPRVVAAVVLAAALVAVLLFSQQRGGPLEVSGFIEAEQIRLGSRIGGRVADVHIEEGDVVERDQVLVELEPFDLVERRAEAAADFAARTAAHARLVAGFRSEEIAQAKARRDRLSARHAQLVEGPRAQEIAVARSEVARAEADLEFAELQQKRSDELFRDGRAAGEELDRANSRLKQARAALAAANEELALLEEGNRPEVIEQARAELEEAQQALALLEAGSRPEDIDEARAAMEAARARLAAVERQLAELEIRAPRHGLVEVLRLEPGDLVQANAPVLSMLDLSRMWVRAYVPENELSLQLGDEVPVRVDSYPGETFLGKITFIAREAEFTPRNVQIPEERSKQVFRIKVDFVEGLDRLRPGMGADLRLRERR